MSEVITLELPESLAFRVRETATRTERRFEDVILDWLERVAGEPPVEMLPDSQILALCDAQMPENQQADMERLLYLNRERRLSRAEQNRLDELMRLYRRGLLRKAQSFKVAVERGLRPPLTS